MAVDFSIGAIALQQATDPAEFTFVARPELHDARGVHSIAVERPGEVWFATQAGGVSGRR